MINNIQSMPDTDTGFNKLSVSSNTPSFGSKRDVAAMLQMSVRSVDNYLAAGLPHVKVSPRRVRFDLEECRVWFKQQFGQQRRGNVAAK
jgi:hypothetical protein